MILVLNTVGLWCSACTALSEGVLLYVCVLLIMHLLKGQGAVMFSLCSMYRGVQGPLWSAQTVFNRKPSVQVVSLSFLHQGT